MEKQSVIHKILEQKYKSYRGFFSNNYDEFHFYDSNHKFKVFINGVDVSPEIDVIIKEKVKEQQNQHAEAHRRLRESGVYTHFNFPIDWQITEHSIEKYRKENLKSDL